MKYRLVDERYAARYLGIATRTLQWWRLIGKGPPYHKIGRLVRYDLAALDSFIEAQTRSSTSEVTR